MQQSVLSSPSDGWTGGHLETAESLKSWYVPGIYQTYDDIGRNPGIYNVYTWNMTSQVVNLVYTW